MIVDTFPDIPVWFVSYLSITRLKPSSRTRFVYIDKNRLTYDAQLSWHHAVLRPCGLTPRG